MALYIVGFRLEHDHTYDIRYASLVTAIEKVGSAWSDPTSFYLLHCNGPIGRLKKYLLEATLLNLDTDLVFMANMKTGQIALLGEPENRPQLAAVLKRGLGRMIK